MKLPVYGLLGLCLSVLLNLSSLIQDNTDNIYAITQQNGDDYYFTKISIETGEAEHFFG